MYNTNFFVLFSIIVSTGIATHDVNLPMYIYLANHMTQQECVQLATLLYANSLDQSSVEELSRDLPRDVTCLSLLMTWENGAGKGQSHHNVANCLKKVNHAKLAEWLSNTVFEQLAQQLDESFLKSSTVTEKISTVPTTTNTLTVPQQETLSKFKFEDDCSVTRSFTFLVLDMVLMYVILMATVLPLFYMLSWLARTLRKSKETLFIKPKFTILEMGKPSDLKQEDEILDTLF